MFGTPTADERRQKVEKEKLIFEAALGAFRGVMNGASFSPKDRELLMYAIHASGEFGDRLRRLNKKMPFSYQLPYDYPKDDSP